MKLILAVLIFSNLAVAALEPPQVSYSQPEVSERTHGITNRFQKDIEDGRLSEKTDLALDSIIRMAVYKLRWEGKYQTADTIEKEWTHHWQGYISRHRGLGDHAPLSKWLADTYDTIEFILGKTICQALRLDDIKTINYALPVVFSCIDHVTPDEYKLHFVPLLSVISFWGTFIGCVGGTWGTGFLFCSPIAWGVSYLTEQYVAPALSQPAWEWACGGLAADFSVFNTVF